MRLIISATASSLVLALAACTTARDAGDGRSTAESLSAGTADTAIGICDPLPCFPGSHWDIRVCGCVPEPVDAGPVCNAIAKCAARSHWDDAACACVPDAACLPVPCPYPSHLWDEAHCACVPNPNPDKCAGPVPCVGGTHWDGPACACVPDAGNACPATRPQVGTLCQGSIPGGCDYAGDICGTSVNCNCLEIDGLGNWLCLNNQ